MCAIADADNSGRANRLVSELRQFRSIRELEEAGGRAEPGEPESFESPDLFAEPTNVELRGIGQGFVQRLIERTFVDIKAQKDAVEKDRLLKYGLALLEKLTEIDAMVDLPSTPLGRKTLQVAEGLADLMTEQLEQATASR